MPNRVASDYENLLPEDIRFERDSLSLDPQQFAALVGVREGHVVEKWEDGSYTIPESVGIILDVMSKHPAIREYLLKMGMRRWRDRQAGRPPLLTLKPGDISFERGKRELSDEQFGGMVGAMGRNVRRWELGSQNPPDGVAIILDVASKHVAIDKHLVKQGLRRWQRRIDNDVIPGRKGVANPMGYYQWTSDMRLEFERALA